MGEEDVQRMHPPDKFLDPFKRASGLLNLGLMHRKIGFLKRALT